MTFWILTMALALMVSAILILVLIRARAHSAGPDSAANFDLEVYRDQLRDVDRDLARGVIGKGDAERVRIEVSRRILAADARGQQTGTEQAQPKHLTRIMAVALAVVLIVGSGLLYRELGAPGYGDLSLERRMEMAALAREQRPDQQQAESQLAPSLRPQMSPEYVELINQLREKVTNRPDDLDGQILLSHHEAKIGDYVAAYQAQARVLALMGDTARSTHYAEYGELLIAAARGYVSPEAESALRTALTLAPGNGPARYYWGLMLAQTGRPDLAFRVWESTLRQGPPDAPWLNPIRAQIEEMAWRAGVKYTLPPAALPPAALPLAGPTREDMDAAAEMSTEDRQEFIRSMVERLSERLASSGGSPAEWARLIGTLGVLGEQERAQTIYDEARTIFADNQTALGEVTAAARQAGLNQ